MPMVPGPNDKPTDKTLSADLKNQMDARLASSTANNPNLCRTCLCPLSAEFLPVGLCRAHANRVEVTRRKAALANYRLKLWNERVGEKSGSPELKNLRDEIGITRVLLEEIINSIDPADKTSIGLAQPGIMSCLDRVESLVNSCHKLDKDMGAMLTEAEAQTVVQSLVELVSNALSSANLPVDVHAKIVDQISTGAETILDFRNRRS